MILMEFYFHFYQCVGLRMGVQTPRKPVTDSYELSYLGARNSLLVFCQSRTCSETLSLVSSTQRNVFNVITMTLEL